MRSIDGTAWVLAVCLSGRHLEAFGSASTEATLSGCVCTACAKESAEPKGPGRVGWSCGFRLVTDPAVLTTFELTGAGFVSSSDQRVLAVEAAQEVWDVQRRG